MEFLLKDFRPYLSYVRNQEYKKIWQKKNRNDRLERRRENHKNNRDRDANNDLLRRQKMKDMVFLALGGECVICGTKDRRLLTIDHVNNDGNVSRKTEGNDIYNYIYRIMKEGSSVQELKQRYQVLCWNHNCAKTHRAYFSLPIQDLSYRQKHKIRLWKEAYDFFGPCRTCGEADLRYLTVSHIHDNGAEKRRNGEPIGASLISRFRVQGWPESLKEDYCLECYNCNCSRRVREKENHLSTEIDFNNLKVPLSQSNTDITSTSVSPESA